MSIKTVARALTPPILWSAAKRLAKSQPPPQPLPPPPPAPPPGDPIALGYVNGLMNRFPKLRDFGFEPTEHNAVALTDFYAEVLPLFYEPAQHAHVRNALARLGVACGDAHVQATILRSVSLLELEINKSPERSRSLRDDWERAGAWASEVAALEAGYGAALITLDWQNSDRGLTLIYYFENHPQLLRGKRVFHMAPEKNLSDWIRAHAGASHYVTSDASGTNADENQDITRITHPENSFDVVICHRVMEHVLDDAKGFSELHRILRPGGMVSFSVPQSPQKRETAEWFIPDLTHHGHLRQYGADLENRMRAPGFQVELEPWLLRRNTEELRSRGAYPMRIFHLRKPAV